MVVGVILDDEELLHIAIKGLPEEYNAFRSAIRTRSTTLSFDELATMLSAEEESLNDTFERKKKFPWLLILQDLLLIPITLNKILEIKAEGEVMEIKVGVVVEILEILEVLSHRISIPINT